MFIHRTPNREDKNTYPKLTRVPILSKSIHAQLSLELIFSLGLQVLKLLGTGIALAVEVLQSGESGGGELASLLSAGLGETIYLRGSKELTLVHRRLKRLPWRRSTTRADTNVNISLSRRERFSRTH